MVKVGLIRRVLLAAGGTNRVVLEKCPTEIEARTSLGIGVVVPMVVAGIGGAVAMGNLGAPGPLVAIGALAIAVVVGAVDRLMVTAPPGWASMALRAMVTVALAWLIGEQLLVAAFGSEIDAELAAIHAERLETATAQIDEAVDAELERIDTRLAELGVVDGTVSAAREELEEAEAEVGDRLAALEQLEVELSAEIAGVGAAGGTGRPGDGPVAEAKRAEIALARIALDEATGRRDRAASQLDALATTDRPSADADATEIAGLREQRLAAEDGRAARIGEAAAGIAGADGIMARIEALERMGRTPLMAAQIWALRILLLSIDTLPLTVKLAYARRSRRPYDEVLAAYQEVELRRAARIADGGEPVLAPVPSPEVSSAPVAASGAAVPTAEPSAPGVETVVGAGPDALGPVAGLVPPPIMEGAEGSAPPLGALSDISTPAGSPVGAAIAGADPAPVPEPIGATASEGAPPPEIGRAGDHQGHGEVLAGSREPRQRPRGLFQGRIVRIEPGMISARRPLHTADFPPPAWGSERQQGPSGSHRSTAPIGWDRGEPPIGRDGSSRSDPGPHRQEDVGEREALVDQPR
jgi:hypothetical protein